MTVRKCVDSTHIVLQEAKDGSLNPSQSEKYGLYRWPVNSVNWASKLRVLISITIPVYMWALTKGLIE